MQRSPQLAVSRDARERELERVREEHRLEEAATKRRVPLHAASARHVEPLELTLPIRMRRVLRNGMILVDAYNGACWPGA